MSAARLIAARVLRRLEHGGTTLAAEIDRARQDLTDPRDRALLFEICAGTLRWRNEVDALVSRAAGRDISELDPPVRAVLRLGAYQLRHLDRVPHHAIVNESVDATRTLGLARAAGFVNGILRALARGAHASAIPSRPGPSATRAEQVAYLTTALSHPEWLATRWLDRVGFEAACRWCEFNNTPPSPTVVPRQEGTTERVLAALSAAGIEATRGRYATGALRLPAGTLGRMPAEIRQALTIQDEGSLLVGLSVRASAGDRVLDACAAPGGKTVVLGRRVGPDGLLVAGDRRTRRLHLLRQTLASAGMSVPMLALDARGPLPFGPVFDWVLLDAPCSGLGTVSRDPDLKWTRLESDLAGYATAQAAMIDAAAAVLRPGGRLVYATCSSEPEENEDVVSAFLARSPGFGREPVTWPDSVSQPVPLTDESGQLSTRPPSHGLDAFFAAVLARHSSA